MMIAWIFVKLMIVISRQYHTHTIRCKGKSIQGKPRKLKFGEDAMHWLKKWLEERGDDDCPYMFVIKKKDGSEIQRRGHRRQVRPYRGRWK